MLQNHKLSRTVQQLLSEWLIPHTLLNGFLYFILFESFFLFVSYLLESIAANVCADNG